MGKKIAFTGPFADINFGDYGMLINNIYDFEFENVVLFSYDSEFLNELINDYLGDFKVEIVNVELSEVNKIEPYPYTPLEILQFVDNFDQIYESLQGVEKLIVNGGGYFNGLWSKPHRFERLCKIISPILVANMLELEIIFTGNSYGPFGEDLEFFSTIFSSLKNVTFGVRDQLYSNMWFNKLGVKKDLNFIPDDLLIINDKIKDSSKHIVFDTDRNYIVLETYLPIEYLKTNINKFKLLVATLKEKFDTDVVFLPFHIGNGGTSQGLFLHEAIESIEYVDITQIGYLPIQDAINIIGNAKLVISSRYHALVIAAANQIPIISNIRDVLGDKRYYYNKNAGLLRQIFDDLAYDERKFLFFDYADSIDYLSKNYLEIIACQQSLYNNAIYHNNISKLINNRNEFIKEYIIG